MKIGIFHPRRGNERLDTVMDSVILGFLEHEKDAEIHVVREEKYVKCDVAIRWGVSNGRPSTAYRKMIDIAHMGPIGVVELGWLGDRRDTYFQFGFGGISGHAKYYYPDVLIRWNRWFDHGITLPQPREQSFGDHILLCGQVPWDTSVQGTNYLQWVYRMLDEIPSYSSLPVYFRPHPLSNNSIPLEEVVKRGAFPTDPGRPLIEDLKGARCLLTYNSNSAVDALLCGVPVIVQNKGSMVYKLAGHGLDQLTSPPYPSRQDLSIRMSQIASSQWTREEFEQNIPWKLAKRFINGH